MANLEHLAILDSGIAKWNEWRNINDTITPDLSAPMRFRVILSGDDPFLPNLSGANFSLCDLSGANLYEADLTGSDLSGANLSEADLSESNLTGADLTEAGLGMANLIRANLSQSNLIGANLTGADLTGADLTGANLTSTNLTNTILTYAILTDTIFESCIIENTTFGMTNLSTCIGLEAVEVRGNCIIDFQTLHASKNIPKSFLLKIGLPELYIEYLPDFYTDTLTLFPAFLSHSKENREFARKLYEALIAKGVNVFLMKNN